MEHVLEHYGVLGDLHEKGDNLVGRCPIHNGSNANQFHVSRTKNNFMCFGNCHEGGNVIDFVVMMEGGNKENGDDVRAAAIRMQEWFGLSFDRPQGGRRTAAAAAMPAQGTASVSTTTAAQEAQASVQPALPLAKTMEGGAPAAEPDQTPVVVETHPEQDATSASQVASQGTSETVKVNPPLKFALKSLDPAHPYLAERGLTTDTLMQFGVGFCTGKGIMAGRIAIPIHNERGELVAYAGRWPGDPPEGEGKYKLPAGFHKSRVVFNLHRAQDYAKDSGLIVVEGFFGCMKVREAGYPNVVALMGSSMSEEQEDLVVAAVGPNGKVALMFDEDEAGWSGRDGVWKDGELKPGVLQRLASKVYVKVIGLGEEGRQPDGMSAEDIARRIGNL